MRRGAHGTPGLARRGWLKRKDSIRVAGFIFAFFLFYFYVFNSAPPPYAHQPVENYALTDDNTFHTVPFFKKSSYERSLADVTLVTQVSVDRLRRLQGMVDTWSGPISAAVYVKQESDLSLITQLSGSSSSIDKYVDFHVLFANKTRYPVNNLRNLAIAHARTDLILVLDADFVTSTSMHTYLSNEGRTLQSSSGAKVAYVIPAFSSSMPVNQLPTNKQDLLDQIKNKNVDLVNEAPCPKCHRPTNYTRWETAGEPYQVDYKWIYEPYLLLNKQTLEENFDERLKGYGFDKNTHTFTLAVAGYSFLVLPSAFVIHINHEVADWDGPSIQDQLWGALKYVCKIIPEVKQKYGYPPDLQLFDEPVGDHACFSRDHW